MTGLITHAADIAAAMRPAVTPAEEQDWIFTFGAGQYAHALLSGAPVKPDELGTGIRLANRYVVIHGSRAGARARMVEIFGQVWAAMYPSAAAAGVQRYKLTELVIV